MGAIASTIGSFRLPPGRGERRGQHFRLFSLADVSLETGGREEIPGQARDEGASLG